MRPLYDTMITIQTAEPLSDMELQGLKHRVTMWLKQQCLDPDPVTIDSNRRHGAVE